MIKVVEQETTGSDLPQRITIRQLSPGEHSSGPAQESTWEGSATQWSKHPDYTAMPSEIEKLTKFPINCAASIFPRERLGLQKATFRNCWGAFWGSGSNQLRHPFGTEANQELIIIVKYSPLGEFKRPFPHLWCMKKHDLVPVRANPTPPLTCYTC